jgi:hypothetical protein
LHAQSPSQLQTEIAALQKQVAALQTTVTTLQGNKALALAPFVTVDPNPENSVRGPTVLGGYGNRENGAHAVLLGGVSQKKLTLPTVSCAAHYVAPDS